MNRKVFIAGLVITLPILAILIANLGRDPHKVNSPLIGKRAPDFILRDIDTGEELSLASLKGTPVVVNFWATWCVPCHEEHRFLVDAARRNGDRVRFVGVVFDDTREAITDFLQQNGSGYPTLVDVQGKTAIAWGVYGVPETFFVDAGGTIVAKHEGPLSPDAITNYLSRMGS